MKLITATHSKLERHRAQSRAIWALVFVVGLLVVLAIVPILTASRAQVHLRLIADVIEPARIAAGELEDDSWERLLADTSVASHLSKSALGARRTHQPGDIARRWATLDSSAVELGPEASSRIIALGREVGSEISGNASVTVAAALRTVTAAEALQEWLDTRIAQEREAAIAVERWNVLLPVVLVPLALLGVFALVIAGREIVALGRVAQESAAALVESTEARAALLRGVTHDLKNPLGAAQGFTELLTAGMLGELSDGPRGAVDRVHHLIGDAIQILKDLTELASAESGMLELTSEPTRLDLLVAESLGDHRASALSHGVSLTARPVESGEAEPVTVKSDGRRIRQILDNLITNALKYTPEKGSVMVSVGRDPTGTGARITVSDTGPGIPEDMREKVFDEFFRLRGHETKSRVAAPSGTGVGLAIGRRLALLLGGDLTVSAAAEGGAEFVLTLPASAPVRASPSEISSSVNRGST
jgi:signal transduction histidine kinase